MRPSDLTVLKARLATFNQVPPTFGLPDLSDLRGHTKDLKKHLNGGGKGGGAGVPSDRIIDAARAFAKTGRLEDCKQARFVAWSPLLLYAQGVPCFIEDEDLFPQLIAEIDNLKGDLRCFRRCWRGLLHAYFAYEPNGLGRANWITLRDYLNSSVSLLSGTGFVADWVAFITDHRNLLTDDPTRRYGDDIVDGNGEIVDQLREALGEGDQSWLSASFFNAQVRAISDRDDQGFKAKLPFAIELLQKHQLLADGALAELLDRYHRCGTPEVNVDLRDYASTKWGPPWLDMNAAKWGRVSDDVRRMVEGWLKLDFIEKFFSLLSEDGVNDPRRLEFWRGLHEHIGDMYFALGRTASQNQSTDFKKIRETMRGRILTLEDTTADNNAFIMQIGGHHFVEFGESGNALRIYDPASRPFDRTRTYVSVHTLKNQGNKLSGERLIHNDTGEGKWELRAIRIIENRTSIDLGAYYRKYDAGYRARPRTQSRPAPRATLARTAVSRQQVISFCHLHRLKFQDLTDRGGQFWIEARAYVAGLTPQLFAWGFRHSAKRDAWYGTVS